MRNSCGCELMDALALARVDTAKTSGAAPATLGSATGRRLFREFFDQRVEFPLRALFRAHPWAPGLVRASGLCVRRRSARRAALLEQLELSLGMIALLLGHFADFTALEVDSRTALHHRAQVGAGAGIKS